MSRTIQLSNGVNMDVTNVPHKPFNGIVPRDLEAGDTYEINNSSGVSVMRVVSKENQDGVVLVRSERVV